MGDDDDSQTELWTHGEERTDVMGDSDDSQRASKLRFFNTSHQVKLTLQILLVVL